MIHARKIVTVTADDHTFRISIDGPLSLAEMARAEGWATITPGTSAPPRTRPVRGPNPNYPKPPETPGDQPA